MEYIKADEFLKQSEEVQKVFLNWWKPSSGDLFQYRKLFNVVDYCSGTTIQPFYNSYAVFKKDCIPLFTEGQLRKFIEDKTGCKVRLEPYQNSIGIKGTQINLVRRICLSFGISKPYYEEQVYKCFDGLDVDVIKAYWQVAVKIAKESLNKNN